MSGKILQPQQLSNGTSPARDEDLVEAEARCFVNGEDLPCRRISADGGELVFPQPLQQLLVLLQPARSRWPRFAQLSLLVLTELAVSRCEA